MTGQIPERKPARMAAGNAAAIRKIALGVMILFFLLPGGWLLQALTVPLGAFSAAGLAGWEDERFRGTTDYALVRDGDRQVLQAHSEGGASAKVFKVKADAVTTPILRWSWKVERSLPGEDVTRKEGDDFAARVYVVFPRPLFWQTRALNYVWAAKMPKGSVAPSPYTDHNQLVAVESGNELAGRWEYEERNIYQDFRRIFHEEPPAVGAIAVMTDTDDTRDEVTAWYGDITLSSQ